MKFKRISFYNWNLTHKKEINLYEPKNLNELKFFFKNIVKQDKFFIRTGECSYGDKSISSKTKNCLSLKWFNKILSFNKRLSIVKVEAGINLYYLSEYLFQKGYYIYNIPGGKSVTLGGAISGNVHGRISNNKFSTFGDNIVSITVLDENLNLKKINKTHKLFYNIIGSMGIFQTIISAEIKVQKFKNECFSQKKNFINGYKEFQNYFMKTQKFYGFLNLFNNNFEGIFYREKLIKKNLKKNNFGNPININRLEKLNFLSFFVNIFSLKMIYKIFFFIKRNKSIKENIVKFGEILYPSSLINILPIFFRNGMMELQLSIDPKNFTSFHKNLIKLNKEYKFYFYYILIKKMHKAGKKFFTNFPNYNLTLTLSFSKNQFMSNPIYFKKFQKILKKYKCDIYVTKDEIMLEYYKRKILKKFKSYQSLKNSKFTNIFKEKLLKV